MPLYEYECQACRSRFEMIQKFSDKPPDECPKCGKGPVERLLSSPAIQFKGTGWYITDYSQKGKPPTSETPASASSEGKDAKAGGKKDGGGATDSTEKPAAAKPESAPTAPSTKTT